MSRRLSQQPVKVSVLMPVHNGARFMRTAIDSILAQTFRDFELLIIDDDSSDDTVSIARGVKDARVRCLTGHGRRGLAGSLNIGLEAAGGIYIARLDHDDVARADRLATQVAVLDARDDVALVGSQATLIDEHGRRLGVVNRPLSRIGIRWFALVDNPLIHSSVVFRADVGRALGGYDAGLTWIEDYEFWGRMLRDHVIENVSERLIAYRQSAASMMGRVEGDAQGDRRRQLLGIMTTLIGRHVKAELGGEWGHSEAALLARFVLGIEPGQRDEFLTLFARLRRDFEAKWGAAATGEPDYWQTMASQYDAIAYRMTPPSRLAAAGVYAHACRMAPRAAVRLPWMRALALLAAGKHGRRHAGNAASRVVTH
jgi:glycosyltransferase involved in cell wall biosynthesis